MEELAQLANVKIKYTLTVGEYKTRGSTLENAARRMLKKLQEPKDAQPSVNKKGELEKAAGEPVGPLVITVKRDGYMEGMLGIKNLYVRGNSQNEKELYDKLLASLYDLRKLLKK